MKLQELYESLSDPYEFKVTEKDDDSYVAKFSTKNGDVEFGAAPISNDGKSWEIAFDRKTPAGTSHYGVTGQGDEFRVFATIFAIVKDFAKHYSPDAISFTSEKSETSRTKLYQRFVKRFKLDGYESVTDSTASDYRTYFTFKKKAADKSSNILKLSSTMRHRD